MITSVTNARIKHIQLLAKKAKARREEGLFLVEGPRMFFEAPVERIERAYLSESFYGEMEDRAILDRISWELVADRVFAQAAETVHSQGVLCIMRAMGYGLSELLRKDDPLLLLLEDLQDPGNVGTIFRTAEGAGVDGIILTKNCVDIYNPKTIRSTMGSVYRMPFVCLGDGDLSPVLDCLRERGVDTCAAHLQGNCVYDREDYTGGTMFLIGNEGNGLSDGLSASADKKVRIPMEGCLESLNAGVAAAVLMYEAYRQRRRARER
ncbi:MAG TPA: 23S rRNA (guanosine(2251)-2'-O)-methyltransferase RlmB [Lachnospiraceae bacterium]|nr:23S rRNA (guanosine(2251)-2'-O)-methyltransferase RlmB [Lachnospiraceae bacterium]